MEIVVVHLMHYLVVIASWINISRQLKVLLGNLELHVHQCHQVMLHLLHIVVFLNNLKLAGLKNLDMQNV